jgi:hypothetical protein
MAVYAMNFGSKSRRWWFVADCPGQCASSILLKKCHGAIKLGQIDGTFMKHYGAKLTAVAHLCTW